MGLLKTQIECPINDICVINYVTDIVNLIKNVKNSEHDFRKIFTLIFRNYGLVQLVPYHPFRSIFSNKLTSYLADDFSREYEELFDSTSDRQLMGRLNNAPNVILNIISNIDENNIRHVQACILLFHKYIRNELRLRCGWSTPNVIAIEYILGIMNGHRLIELGGGVAYWAYILRSFGADIIVTDRYYPMFNHWIRKDLSFDVTFEVMSDDTTSDDTKRDTNYKKLGAFTKYDYACSNSRVILNMFNCGKTNSIFIQWPPPDDDDSNKFNMERYELINEKAHKLKMKNRSTKTQIENIQNQINTLATQHNSTTVNTTDTTDKTDTTYNTNINTTVSGVNEQIGILNMEIMSIKEELQLLENEVNSEYIFAENNYANEDSRLSDDERHSSNYAIQAIEWCCKNNVPNIFITGEETYGEI